MYNFWKAGPLKFGTAKKTSKIHSDFFTTFDFDSEYLRNDHRYSKSEQNVIYHLAYTAAAATAAATVVSGSRQLRVVVLVTPRALSLYVTKCISLKNKSNCNCCLNNIIANRIKKTLVFSQCIN